MWCSFEVSLKLSDGTDPLNTKINGNNNGYNNPLPKGELFLANVVVADVFKYKGES